MENESQRPKELASWESEEELSLDGRENRLRKSGHREDPDELVGGRGSAWRAFLRKVPLKIKILSLVVVAILIILIFGVALPLALDNDETQYLSDATLKSAVDIGDLEVVDYTYKGIADKTSQFLWAENVDYPVLDETKFGYLPENATADVRDVIALCKEDVASEFSDAGLRTEAMESVRETVEALIRPLLDSAWQIEFEEVSAKEESGREGMQNEAE